MNTHTTPTNAASQYMNAQELGHMLGFTVQWVYRHTANGTIPVTKIGRRNYYDRTTIGTWIKSLERGPSFA